jgi:hypothetical protein
MITGYAPLSSQISHDEVFLYTPQVKGIQLSVGKTAETEKKKNGIDKS